MAHWTARSIALHLSKSKSRQSLANWMTLCPAHDDKGASLSLRDKDADTVLVNCLAGCDFLAIAQALSDRGCPLPRKERQFKATAVSGKSTKNEAPAPAAEPEKPEWIWAPDRAGEIPFSKEMLGWRSKYATSVWDWRDKDGNLKFHTVRFDEKDGSKNIVPVTPRVHTETNALEWRQLGPEGMRPFYNLENDRGQEIVLVVEGEKTAETAKAFFKSQPNVWVTTTLGGCKSPHLVDWAPMKGRKIVICHDYDGAGFVYAATVSENCYAAGAKICHLWTLRANEVIKNKIPSPRKNTIPTGYDLFDAAAENWTLPLLLLQNMPWHGPEIARWR